MNNINISTFNSSQEYINGELIDNYNSSLNYNGDTLDITYQNNNNIIYKKLDTSDLMNLININYNNNTMSLFDTLEHHYLNDEKDKITVNNKKSFKKTFKKSKKKNKKNSKVERKKLKSVKNDHLIDNVF